MAVSRRDDPRGAQDTNGDANTQNNRDQRHQRDSSRSPWASEDELTSEDEVRQWKRGEDERRRVHSEVWSSDGSYTVDRDSEDGGRELDRDAAGSQHSQGYSEEFNSQEGDDNGRYASDRKSYDEYSREPSNAYSHEGLSREDSFEHGAEQGGSGGQWPDDGDDASASPWHGDVPVDERNEGREEGAMIEGLGEDGTEGQDMAGPSSGDTPEKAEAKTTDELEAEESLNRLLEALQMRCDATQRGLLLHAFMCPVCDSQSHSGTSTTVDQIRAVHDAFRLIDADADGQITLTDLRDIASWAADESSTDFINNLMFELPQDENAPISSTEFVLAFARCLAYHEGDEVAEVLERRASEYRRIGKLLGMERVNLHFNSTKFYWTLVADVLAPITFPMSKALDWLNIAYEIQPNGERIMLTKKLVDNQWLPEPHHHFDEFQWYLMKLWVPSLFALVVMLGWLSDMGNVSVMEIGSSITQFMIIATYIATISGYEHSKLVVRRLQPIRPKKSGALAVRVQQSQSRARDSELNAVFAFRAHTPEGHAVDQIAAIAEMLFSRHFKTTATMLSVAAGVVHALTPMLHRIFIHAADLENEHSHTCKAPPQLPLSTQIYVWVCGGRGLVHALASVPAACVSGYLTFHMLRLAFKGFYSDMNFYYKLQLFRAATQAEPFLRYRGRWKQAEAKGNVTGRREFLQFLNLQKHDDLLLWCRIRHLLVESYASFQTKQGDIIVSFLISLVVVYTFYIFFGSTDSQLSVFDLRARLDVILYSALLLGIINLKLSIHHLRKSDIYLLHKEYYFSCMAESDDDEGGQTRDAYDEDGSRMSGSHYDDGSRRKSSSQRSSRSGFRGTGRYSGTVGVGVGGHLEDMGDHMGKVEQWRRGRDQESGDVIHEDIGSESVSEEEEEEDNIHVRRAAPAETAFTGDGAGIEGGDGGGSASSTPRLRGWGGQSPTGSNDDPDANKEWDDQEQRWSNPDTFSERPSAMEARRGGSARRPDHIVTGEAVGGFWYPQQHGHGQDGGRGGTGGGPNLLGQWPQWPNVNIPQQHMPEDFSDDEIPEPEKVKAHTQKQHRKLQALLVHTARYIAEFDKPPRLLSFTVSVSFVRYIFFPLLSPFITLLRSYAFDADHDQPTGRYARH